MKKEFTDEELVEQYHNFSNEFKKGLIEGYNLYTYDLPKMELINLKHHLETEDDYESYNKALELINLMFSQVDLEKRNPEVFWNSNFFKEYVYNIAGDIVLKKMKPTTGCVFETTIVDDELSTYIGKFFVDRYIKSFKK